MPAIFGVCFSANTTTLRAIKQCLQPTRAPVAAGAVLDLILQVLWGSLKKYVLKCPTIRITSNDYSEAYCFKKTTKIIKKVYCLCARSNKKTQEKQLSQEWLDGRTLPQSRQKGLAIALNYSLCPTPFIYVFIYTYFFFSMRTFSRTSDELKPIFRTLRKYHFRRIPDVYDQ